MSYKFVIASAGLGSRVGPFTKFMNKAMITIGNKPAICHIIDLVPLSVEVIIIIGYRGILLKQVLNEMYKHRKLTFIKVDKYQGAKSSLGYSLLQAKDHLMCPFIFSSNDTLVSEDLNLNPIDHGNWIGFYKKIDGDRIDIQQYRTLNINSNFVNNINPKGILNNNIYIGLAGIKDYKDFWKYMLNSKNLSAGESIGISQLHDKKAIEFRSWRDTGNINSLTSIQNDLKDSDNNILPKENESIWFLNGSVIKFHENKKFIKDRIKRVRYLPKKAMPVILNHKSNFYSYKKIEGKILSSVINIKILEQLLDFMQNNVWCISSNLSKKTKVNVMKEFYYNKTLSRINDYNNKYEYHDQDEIINDINCLKVEKIIKKIDWKRFYRNNNFAHFHGDFHNENILYDKNNFYLLDWRQNFGEGNYEFGDIYYDLAKLYHGLLLSHKSVNQKKYFNDFVDNNTTKLGIFRPKNLIDCQVFFEKWIIKNDYDLYKVKILTYIIFINIAVLHEPPYSNFLYKFGKFHLNKFIN